VDRLFVAVMLLSIAGVAAWVLNRRTDADTPAGGRFAIPAQLDRREFAGSGTPWLVAAFTSATCDTCADLTLKVQALESAEVATDVVEVSARSDLHRRYAIDAVPMVLVVDAEGVVRASFVGPVTATDLWATVAEVREPGSIPDGCDHGQPG